MSSFSDPGLALQIAVIARIKAEVAEIGGRVYDQPPPKPTFPYVTIGETETLADLATCYDGSETFLTLHVWSRAVGFPEAKRIAAAIRATLHDADLALDGHALSLLHFRSAQALRDPDGATSHVVLSFRALSLPDRS